MPYKFRKPFGEQVTLNFALWETDGIDVNATASAVLGDVVIFKDEGTSANAAHLFSAHTSGFFTTLVLSATETNAARVVVQIIDQSTTKEWLDEYLIVETYGVTAAAEHNFSAIAETTLGLNLADVEHVASRSLINAARFLRNRWRVNGSALSVFAEDDTTTAWTVALDTVASAAPVIDFNPD